MRIWQKVMKMWKSHEMKQNVKMWQKVNDDPTNLPKCHQNVTKWDTDITKCLTHHVTNSYTYVTKNQTDLKSDEIKSYRSSANWLAPAHWLWLLLKFPSPSPLLLQLRSALLRVNRSRCASIWMLPLSFCDDNQDIWGFQKGRGLNLGHKSGRSRK